MKLRDACYDIDKSDMFGKSSNGYSHDRYTLLII